MAPSKKTPSVDPVALGRRVKELRHNRKWNQVKLAEKAGVSQATVSQVERGDRTPGLDAVGCLAEALDVTVEFLAYGTEGTYEIEPEVQVMFRDAARLSNTDREILKHHLQLLLGRSKEKNERES